MSKISLFVIGLLFSTALYTSCEDKGTIDTNTGQSADIVAFTFTGIYGEAEIDRKARSVKAKADETVDLTAVVAVFTLPDRAIAKVGGIVQESRKTTNNFTHPVIYKITSGDGKTVKNWTITIIGGYDENNINNDNGKNVYVAGTKYYLQWNGNYTGEIKSSNPWMNVFVATLWKNGKAQNLTDGTYFAGARSVYVSDRDVYVAGYEYNAQGGSIAKLWKNGVAENLSDGTYRGAGAISVFVSGSNVYVAGVDDGGATLWKNGVAQKLTDGSSWSQANSVYVSDNDVYVVGWKHNEKDILVATLWKNGVAQYLTDGTRDAEVHSVYESNGDVYIAGSERSVQNRWVWIAKLWKNDAVQNLTDETKASGGANSVLVSSGDVYVTGRDEGTLFSGSYVENFKSGSATLWKNGIPQHFTDGTNYSDANSVFVAGSDVYVAGEDAGIAKLWKSGVAQNLGSGTAWSVYVK